MAIHIGTSGWSYDHWESVLYPQQLLPRLRLDYYIQHYHTVEVNSTYYRWPSDSTFASWRQRLPYGFLMSVKAPRGLTHSARLYAPEKWLDRICSGLRRLGDKLGILLVQLSPQFSYDYARLAYFLETKPPWLKVAIEFRHPSWHIEEVFSLLSHNSSAYCVMSGAHLPCLLRATGSFVYVRMHGPDPHHLYSGFYSDADLHWWASRLCEWEELGYSVFVYFNNDGGGNAVLNASKLKTLVGAGTS